MLPHKPSGLAVSRPSPCLLSVILSFLVLIFWMALSVLARLFASSRLIPRLRGRKLSTWAKCVYFSPSGVC